MLKEIPRIVIVNNVEKNVIINDDRSNLEEAYQSLNAESIILIEDIRKSSDLSFISDFSTRINELRLEKGLEPKPFNKTYYKVSENTVYSYGE